MKNWIYQNTINLSRETKREKFKAKKGFLIIKNRLNSNIQTDIIKALKKCSAFHSETLIKLLFELTYSDLSSVKNLINEVPKQEQKTKRKTLYTKSHFFLAS